MDHKPILKQRVLHFIRKSSQINASFIYNQVTGHIDFEPFVVFRKNVDYEKDDGFWNCNLIKVPYLDLSENETLEEKLRFKSNKTLSCRQIGLILDFIKTKNIDICHFHYGSDCGVFYPILKRLIIPSVVSFYGYDCFSFPKKYFGLGQSYLKRRVFANINKVLSMTSEMEKDLISIGCPREKITIHYHGIPSHLVSIERDYKRKQKLSFLMLSYLDPVKGHIFVFKALMKLLTKGIHNFTLTIVGSGHYEQTLKLFVKEKHLESFVHFHGSVPYLSKTHTELLKNADIFLHPSVITEQDKEGVPGAIVEAMCAGLPVIATYHGGIPHLIKNEKNGLLVKEWDVHSLAKAIIYLMSNHEKREEIGRNGKDYATQYLDIALKEKDLENIYANLISKG